MRAVRGAARNVNLQRQKSNLHAFSEIHSEPPRLTIREAAFAGFL